MIKSDLSEKLGDGCGLGWTIGEEILFTKNDGQAIKRLETVTASKESCLLQLKTSDLQALSLNDQKPIAGGSFIKDYTTLMSFLESNFTTKNDWRINNNIKV